MPFTQHKQYTPPAPTCSTLPSTTVPRSLYLDRIGRRSDPLAEYEVRLMEVLFAGQFGAEGCVSSTVTVAVESTKVVEHLVQWSDGCEMPELQYLGLVHLKEARPIIPTRNLLHEGHCIIYLGHVSPRIAEEDTASVQSGCGSVACACESL